MVGPAPALLQRATTTAALTAGVDGAGGAAALRSATGVAAVHTGAAAGRSGVRVVVAKPWPQPRRANFESRAALEYEDVGDSEYDRCELPAAARAALLPLAQEAAVLLGWRSLRAAELGVEYPSEWQ